MRTLYQKYRPVKLDDVIGHRNQIAQIKSWIKNGFPQSIYISGETGRGKTTLARIIAMSINCIGSGEKPCGNCDSCLSVINETFHLDISEINASNLNIDAARELDSISKLNSFYGGKRIWIINEFQELADNPKARKNLLELLENKNNNVHTIITSMDDSKTEKAIRDRCAQIRLKALSEEDLISHLIDICEKEKIAINEDKLDVLVLIAQNSGGSVRTALTLLNDVIDMNLWNVRDAENELCIISDSNLIKHINMILKGDPAIFDIIPSRENLDRIKWLLITAIKIKSGANVSSYEKKIIGNIPELFTVSRIKYVLDLLMGLYNRSYIDSAFIHTWVIDCILSAQNQTSQNQTPVIRGRR